MVRPTFEVYFDFLSPYSWLAFEQLEAWRAAHSVDPVLRPILYGALLDRTGMKGAGEEPRRRAHAHRDVQRIAHRLGVPFRPPPRHPFVSLLALRTQVVFEMTPQAFDLARALFRACWSQGRDLSAIDVVTDVVRGVGLDADDLAERVRRDDVKARLIEHGDAAFAAGVFGLPSFVANGELFFGQDRLDDVARFLAGDGPAVYVDDSAPGPRRAALERPEPDA